MIDVQAAGNTSLLYPAGRYAIAVATLVALVLWPLVLVVLSPRSGIDWGPADYSPATVALVTGGVGWYLSFPVVPMDALSVFTGVGGR
ncbi:hypothetical protein DP107_17165 [Haloglomus irregulare]|uniref:DUF8162 domain-containing protein n=2 Tax=Halobacteriales TaxID=2235 RepID=A0A554MW06_9EURY|nr:hypothetical protein [Haloglomus irregulare]ABT17379.1 hypothetical protein [uncultured haloarchaeon FLAS10H9]TSD09000.1 hypothetical protein DP107_17165 [Haloglomus irregulare]